MYNTSSKIWGPEQLDDEHRQFTNDPLQADQDQCPDRVHRIQCRGSRLGAKMGNLSKTDLVYGEPCLLSRAITAAGANLSAKHGVLRNEKAS